MKMLNPKRLHPAAGVTLVEMMVVIVIIGLITGIVVINVLPSLGRAKVETARIDVMRLQDAIQLYTLNNGGRPPSMEEGLAVLASKEGGKQATIANIPTDPWGNPYQFVVPGKHGPIDIYSFGADGREGGEGENADIGNWHAQ